MPPNRLPATAEENEWLAAIADLERVGNWQAAATGYTAALKRWDKSYLALMGLGNSKFNMHELGASESAFLQAIQLQPENGLAYNNLAYVLLEQGRLGDALTAAQHAVDRNGPFQNSFRQTLDEIKRIASDREQ